MLSFLGWGLSTTTITMTTGLETQIWDHLSEVCLHSSKPNSSRRSHGITEADRKTARERKKERMHVETTNKVAYQRRGCGSMGFFWGEDLSTTTMATGLKQTALHAEAARPKRVCWVFEIKELFRSSLQRRQTRNLCGVEVTDTGHRMNYHRSAWRPVSMATQPVALGARSRTMNSTANFQV